MKEIHLEALNKGLFAYGYSDHMTWKTEEFNGHQKGVCIGIIKKVPAGQELTEEYVVENYMPKIDGQDNGNKSLVDLISNKGSTNVVLVSTETVMDNEPVEVFYLPYGVAGHSIFRPTVNYENIDECANKDYQIEIELGFVSDFGFNRYITFKESVHNKSVMGAVSGFFDRIKNADTNDEDTVSWMRGYGFRPGQEENDNDWYLDFYDEAGNVEYLKVEGGGKTLERLCVSARLVGLIAIVHTYHGVSSNEEKETV